MGRIGRRSIAAPAVARRIISLELIAAERRQEIQMKHWVIVVLAAVTVLRSAALGQTSPPAQSPVPFTATLTGPLTEQFEIPVSPPILAVKETGTGQADLLGAFEWVGHLMQHGAPDFRTPRLVSDGIGVMKAANGDALFFTYAGKVIVGIDTQSRELAFTITGGQGKFLGATGSGLFRDNVDFNLRKLIRSVEGTLSVPAAK
jgi:hypothetical protein